MKMEMTLIIWIFCFYSIFSIVKSEAIKRCTPYGNRTRNIEKHQWPTLPCTLEKKKLCSKHVTRTWWKDGHILQPKLQKYIFTKKNKSMQIYDFRKTDQGVYECRITSDRTNFNITAQLNFDEGHKNFRENTLAHTIPFNDSEIVPGELYWSRFELEHKYFYMENLGMNNYLQILFHFILGNGTNSPVFPTVKVFFSSNFEDYRDDIGRPIDPNYFNVTTKLSYCYTPEMDQCYEGRIKSKGPLLIGHAGVYTVKVTHPSTNRTLVQPTFFSVNGNFFQPESTKPRRPPMTTFHSLKFNMDSEVCAGKNFTFKCHVEPPGNSINLYLKYVGLYGNSTEELIWSYTGTQINIVNPTNKSEVHSVRTIYRRQDGLFTIRTTMNSTGYYHCAAVGPFQTDEKDMFLRVVDCSPTMKNSWIIVVVIASTLVIVTFLALVLRQRWRIRQDKKPAKRRIIILNNGRYPTQTSSSTEIEQRPVPLPEERYLINVRHVSGNPIYGINYQLPHDPDWEISRSRIRIHEMVGEGNFGIVHRAVFQRKNYAAKMLRNDHSESEVRDLVREFCTLKSLGSHPNIIGLQGICSQSGPLIVLLEYAPYGSLLNFLRARREYDSTLEYPDLSESDMRGFCRDVACGMEFVSSFSVLHRDLAARNVLIGDNRVAKVADFGMTRVISNYYQKKSDGSMPIRWMSPEALRNEKITIQSDVWSFGVLMWEVFTMGGQPYPTMSVNNLTRFLVNGGRNSPPPFGTPEDYRLMQACWQLQPENRPTFGDLFHMLNQGSRVASNSVDYLDMGNQSTSPTDYVQMESGQMDAISMGDSGVVMTPTSTTTEVIFTYSYV